MKKGYSGSVFDGTTLEAFFSLPTHAAQRKPNFLLKTTFMSVFMTFVLATKSKFFGEEMSLQRFLQSEWVPFVGGLITKYTLIMIGGSQDISACVDYNRHFEFGSTLVPLYVRFPHCCAPNVSIRTFGRKSVIFTHYPIKKGERVINLNFLYYFMLIIHQIFLIIHNNSLNISNARHRRALRAISSKLEGIKNSNMGKISCMNEFLINNKLKKINNIVKKIVHCNESSSGVKLKKIPNSFKISNNCYHIFYNS